MSAGKTPTPITAVNNL